MHGNPLQILNANGVMLAFDPVQTVKIFRNIPVILDSTVAVAFGVETRQVNQAVKRNPLKFGTQHRFQLTADELEVLRSQGVISKSGRGGSRTLPFVYTQKGLARLATVLDTPQALTATDRMIDLCTEVYQQIAEGRREVVVNQPSRHVPDRDTLSRVAELRNSLYAAISDLLRTKVRPDTGYTLADEIGETAVAALDMLKAHLQSKSLENEKVGAETLLIVEKAREIRDRTRADVGKTMAEAERIHLENFDKRLQIAERCLELANRMEPDAVAALTSAFASSRQMIAPKP